MPENNGDTRREALAIEALLYASGALGGPAEAAFEKRLGDDQRARDALSRAVAFFHGDEPPRPDPAYRERVRQHLQPRRGLLAWLLRPRWYRGHPAAWGGLGAAAAVLVMFVFLRGSPAAPALPAPAVHDVAAHGAGIDDEETVAAQARIWADMPRSEHLQKASEEQARRRARAETLLRLVKMDDGRSRLVAPTTIKN
jgi:hypothetical protein